jgi:uncharacterized protein (DUF1015 family)
METMARIQPFSAYRYDLSHVRAADVITQPYDKITPDMRQRYLAQSPYNLVRVILGEKHEGDNDGNNVYTRARGYLNEWIQKGILRADPEPGVYPYTQSFASPDTGEHCVRRGFIALGGIEDYANQVVFRHEQTLSGPKADRRALLQATRTHFGQIFMLYSDPSQATEAELLARAQNPIFEATDEYGTTHRLFQETDGAVIARLHDHMASQKLVIADGHHRYETALQWRNECNGQAPHRPDHPWNWVMMTFINADAPGLIVLPTHRLIYGLAGWDAAAVTAKLHAYFDIEPLPGISLKPGNAAEVWTALRPRLAAAGATAIAMVLQGISHPSLLRPKASLDLAALLPEASPEQRRLNLVVLHRLALDLGLGITPEMVREERHLRYLRSAPEALESVAVGAGQAAFLVNAIPASQVREVALAGGVMPQKSTDFFPKLLTGLTMYRVE